MEKSTAIYKHQEYRLFIDFKGKWIAPTRRSVYTRKYPYGPNKQIEMTRRAEDHLSL